MVRSIKTLLVIALFCVVNVAADWPNSECLNSGTFNCQDQGRRLCINNPVCAGSSCYNCYSTPTIPALVCFVKEGQTCEPVNPLDCGPKSADARCVAVGMNCVCEDTVATSGNCDFTSCKQKAP